MRAFVFYINKSNKLVIPFEPIMARSFSEGLAAVSEMDGKWGFIDKRGKLVIPFQYDEVKDFHNGYATFRIDDKWGAINKRGKEVIKPQYAALGQFENNQITACRKPLTEKTGSCGVMTKSGKEIIPFKYYWVNPYQEGFFIAEDKPSSWIYINKHGRIPFGKRFYVADEYFDGLAMVCVTVDKCGFIDKKGEMKIPAEYEGLSPMRNGIAAAMKDGKWGFINKKGKLIIPFEYDWTGLIY